MMARLSESNFSFLTDRGQRALSHQHRPRLRWSPDSKSPFTATADLAHIIWDEGYSRASFDPATQTVIARIASNTRVHQVTLRQTNTGFQPGTATFRILRATDEHTKAEHQKFTATLETGNRWWKSIDGWGKLVTPQEPSQEEQASL